MNDPVNAFDVDAIRANYAMRGDLKSLCNSYRPEVFPDLPDMSSAELWDELANQVESPEFRIRRLKAVAKRTPRNSRVLEVGIGWGEIIPMLLGRGCQYTGIDFSRKIVENIAAKHPTCTFHVGNIARLSPSFDAILALEVCEHIQASRILEFYSHVKRLLAPGGLFILSVPVHENLRATTLQCPHCGHLHNRMGHVRAYTPELISAELALAGFVVFDSLFIYADFGNTHAQRLKRKVVDLGRRVFNLGKTLPLNVVVLARNPC